MKITRINNLCPNFGGQRQDRKTVEQLKENNKYALNLSNQRKINKAIDNLSKNSEEKNIEFLLDVADNLKYGTHIYPEKKSYNDWEIKLYDAAQKALQKADDKTKQKYTDKIINNSISIKPLTQDEKEIIQLEQAILQKTNFSSLKDIPNSNIKNIKRNLDYFVVSSEVPTAQKIYILKRLNYFMSYKYKINPQLKDKKSIALAEMVNDIVVSTPESKIPNIKAINQKSHGMCGAISIVRKALAYEDKANYIDSILSELDDSENLMVYDIANLGSNKRIPVPKINIDYDYALSKGYRIVDTAAINWMAVGDLTGIHNEPAGTFCAFDKNNFDVFQDAHIINDLDNSIVDKQDYYRAEVKAKSEIGNYKKYIEKTKYYNSQKTNQKNEISNIQKYNGEAIRILKEISPESNFTDLHRILKDLMDLGVSDLQKQNNNKEYYRNFTFLPNEEYEAKIEKIKAFLSIAFDKKTTPTDKQVSTLLNITSELKELTKSNNYTIGSRISNAKALYNAAAAYRYQKVMELGVRDRRDEELQKYNIPDSETVLSKNIEEIINQLENNSMNPIKQKLLAQNIGSKNNTADILDTMEKIKDSVNYIKKDIYDNLYIRCCAINRKLALNATLEAAKKYICNCETTEELVPYAQKLGVEPKRHLILAKLNNYINILSKPDCTEEEYLKIFNSVGLKSQLYALKETIDNVGDMLFVQRKPNAIKGFNLMNGLEQDAPFDETREVFKNIVDNFNQISDILSRYISALTIDYDNEIINTPSPELKLIKNLEAEGKLPKYKELRTLQNRFNKIEKEKMGEYGISKKYKDLPDELITLTALEKNALKKYKKNINSWYSEVSRKLNYSFANIQPELEELNRQTGIKTGNYWVSPEGRSGLGSNQEVKIYEYMTDRPYYIESNSKRAISKIKSSPYSGVSSTSVDHRMPAMHAQYIADIKPIEINENGVKKYKEAIFHDNTWGASEHENTWTDTKGLTRTDYSSGYGGRFGFITNEKYLNGNLLENILNNPGEYNANIIPSKIYKKLSNGSESYKFSMMPDIITPGQDLSTMSYVRQIRQNLLLSPAGYLDELTELANQMTEDELKAAIAKVKNSASGAYEKYKRFMKRIEGDNIIDKGISTLEDFNKLSDDDELKIFLEKVAILKTYSGIPELKNFYQTQSLKDLSDAKNKIRSEARKNFEYVFAKNIDIVKYGVESSRAEIYEKLKDFAKDNNFSLSAANIAKIVNSIKKISNSDFDGNINNTIELMSSNFEKNLNNYIPENLKDSYAANKINKDIKNIISKNFNPTLKDIKTYFSSSYASQWIDKEFNPTTDEEFLEIFNNLRSMTTKEFNRLYADKITDKELGIKDVSGYDVLVQLRAENEIYQNALLNAIYSQIHYQNVNISKTAPLYDYNKFSRKLQGAKYTGKRTFDDLYIEYYYALKELYLEKEFNKVKQQNFEKYGVLPAYPKIEIVSEEKLENTVTEFIKSINENINSITAYKNQIKVFDIIHDVQKTVNKNHKTDGTLTKHQYMHITEKLKDFLNITEEDNTVEDLREKINDILSSETKSAQDFKNLIDNIYKELEAYEKTPDGNSIKKEIQEYLGNINIAKKYFIFNSISEKYQDKAMLAINKYIKAQTKAFDTQKDKDYEIAQEEYLKFREIFNKHRITLEPNEILNTYLLMNAKNNKYEKMYLTKNNNKEAEKLFNESKSAFESNLTGLLQNANIQELQTILMECSREGNLNVVQKALKESTLEFKDGTIVPLNSTKGLRAIINPLLAEESLNSAQMFINQFGFGQEAVKMISEGTNFENAKFLIKKIFTTMQKLDKETGIIKEELEKIKNEEIDTSSNYAELIEQHKQNIMKKLKRNSNKINLEIYNAAIQDALNKIKKYPESSKFAFLDVYLNQAVEVTTQLAANSIQSMNNSLHSISECQQLIMDIKLEPNSEAEKIRNEYINKCTELIDYKSSFNFDFENLNFKIG